jgi:hypothetical protein
VSLSPPNVGKELQRVRVFARTLRAAQIQKEKSQQSSQTPQASVAPPVSLPEPKSAPINSTKRSSMIIQQEEKPEYATVSPVPMAGIPFPKKRLSGRALLNTFTLSTRGSVRSMKSAGVIDKEEEEEKEKEEWRKQRPRLTSASPESTLADFAINPHLGMLVAVGKEGLAVVNINRKFCFCFCFVFFFFSIV